jgi:hypothetical protein
MILFAAALVAASCDNNDYGSDTGPQYTYPELGGELVAVDAPIRVKDEDVSTRGVEAQPIKFEQTFDDGTTIESTLTEIKQPKTRAALEEGTQLLMIAFKENQLFKYQTFKIGAEGENIKIWLPTDSKYRLVFYSLNDSNSIDISKYIEGETIAINDNEAVYGGLIAEGSKIKEQTIEGYGTDALWFSTETKIIGKDPDPIGAILLRHLFCRLANWTIESTDKHGIEDCTASLISTYDKAYINIGGMAPREDVSADDIWNHHEAKADSIPLAFEFAREARESLSTEKSVIFIPNSDDDAKILISKLILDGDPLSRYANPKAVTFNQDSGDKGKIKFTPGKSYKLVSRIKAANKIMIRLRGTDAEINSQGTAVREDISEATNAGVHTTKVESTLKAENTFFVVGWYAIQLNSDGSVKSTTRVPTETEANNAKTGNYSTGEQTLYISEVNEANKNTIYEGRVIAFAGSNIYWNNPSDFKGQYNDGVLTFASDKDHSELVDLPHKSLVSPSDRNINECLFGLYFKFGSLAGTVMTNKSWDIANVSISYYFTPSKNDGWTSNGSRPSWTDTESIPYFEGNIDKDSAFVDLSDPYTSHTGDICKFISSEWRLPTAEEFGIFAQSSSWWDYPKTVTSNITISPDAAGVQVPGNPLIPGTTEERTAYLKKGDNRIMGFALGGARDKDGNYSNKATQEAYYWTSSGDPSAPNEGYCFNIYANGDGDGSITVTKVDRQTGMAVRCVRE